MLLSTSLDAIVDEYELRARELLGVPHLPSARRVALQPGDTTLSVAPSTIPGVSDEGSVAYGAILPLAARGLMTER